MDFPLEGVEPESLGTLDELEFFGLSQFGC
jgi:hypothetical protein